MDTYSTRTTDQFDLISIHLQQCQNSHEVRIELFLSGIENKTDIDFEFNFLSAYWDPPHERYEYPNRFGHQSSHLGAQSTKKRERTETEWGKP